MNRGVDAPESGFDPIVAELADTESLAVQSLRGLMYFELCVELKNLKSLHFALVPRVA